MEEGFINFLIFIIFCGCIYCGVLTFFSLISGWIRLSSISPAPEHGQSDSVQYSSQTVVMGYMTYTMCVNTAFNDTGIIFSMVKPLRFMHKPFILPYEKISDFAKEDLTSTYIEFTFDKIKMKMEGESAVKLEKIIKKKQL